VIISNLINRASVFLNYRLGDLAAWLPGPCPCGRSLPLLSHVEGRSDDWIVLPSGQSVHPQAVVRVYRFYPEIWQHQTIQETPTRLRVSLVTDAAGDRQKIRESVTADLRRTLSEEIEVEIQFVDAIPRTPGGKVRRVISLAAQARLEAERS
jgi:phenylacetate-CoA ligase